MKKTNRFNVIRRAAAIASIDSKFIIQIILKFI